MTSIDGATDIPGGSIAVPRPPAPAPAGLDSFSYDDDIVRKFMVATFVWGLVGMLVGLVVALQLVEPSLNFASWFSFGRLRPLHTNAVIFAFAGNAFFTGCYYSTQRLCKTRMFSDGLGRFHFWGWQLIIVAAAITLPLGFTQAKEYAELEWPIDIAIAVVWVAFAVNFFGTLKQAARAASVRGALVLHREHHHASRCCTSSTTSRSRPARSRATRSTRARRTRSCSGGTATTRSRSS